MPHAPPVLMFLYRYVDVGDFSRKEVLLPGKHFHVDRSNHLGTNSISINFAIRNASRSEILFPSCISGPLTPFLQLLYFLDSVPPKIHEDREQLMKCFSLIMKDSCNDATSVPDGRLVSK
jgi:hypothetical protein